MITLSYRTENLFNPIILPTLGLASPNNGLSNPFIVSRGDYKIPFIVKSTLIKQFLGKFEISLIDSERTPVDFTELELSPSPEIVQNLCSLLQV